jgi:hypothetical protein
MHDQAGKAERLRAVEFFAKGGDGLAPQVALCGRDVDQITVVRDDGVNASLAHAATEEIDLGGRQFASPPLSR